MFDGPALKGFIAQATWVAVNDYEARMLSERVGASIEELSRSHLQGVIVTLGAAGCEVWVQGRCETVPGVAAESVVDPTGCGDAFRGALLYGLERGWPLADCVRLGNRLGALKIAQRGGQNHQVDRVALGLA
jgi:adenosine kinase